MSKQSYISFPRKFSEIPISAVAVSLSVALVGILLAIPRRSAPAPRRLTTPPIVFLPSNKWQVVQEYHICPPGLTYKIDLESGVKLAKKL